MPDISLAVREFANALRAAMRAGDGLGTVDRKLLQAILAENANNALQWVRTRVPDGDVVGKPLADLAPALAEGDLIGGGLQQVRDQALKQAKTLAYATVTGAALPIWLSSAAAVIAGIFGSAQEAGATVGAALIPALVAGGSVLYVIVRLIAASSGALKAVGGAASSAWADAGSIGAHAESVFREHVGPAESGLAAHGYRPGGALPVLAQLRGAAQLILGASYVLFAGCVLFFAVGMYNAFDAWSQQQLEQQHQRTCLRLPDGTCVGE